MVQLFIKGHQVTGVLCLVFRYLFVRKRDAPLCRREDRVGAKAYGQTPVVRPSFDRISVSRGYHVSREFRMRLLHPQAKQDARLHIR